MNHGSKEQKSSSKETRSKGDEFSAHTSVSACQSGHFPLKQLSTDNQVEDPLIGKIDVQSKELERLILSSTKINKFKTKRTGWIGLKRIRTLALSKST